MTKLTHTPVRPVAVVTSRYRCWRTQRALNRELSALSDETLKDIGVCRYDIPRVAKAGKMANQLRRTWPGKPLIWHSDETCASSTH